MVVQKLVPFQLHTPVTLRYYTRSHYRMKLCYLLPKVKSALKIPADMHLLQQLEMCVRKLLCQEKDKDVLAIVKKTVLELDRMEMSMDMFQKKNYEKDLLDQEKEREELLFLEMEQLEKEKHQSDGRLASDKSFEKKRRDSRTSTQSLSKNLPISVPGPSSSTASTSKEIKKSKLTRSQSFNNQAFHAKYGTLDKCASKSSTLAHTSSVSGLVRTAMLSLTDDSFRTRNASSVPASFSPNPVMPSTSRGPGNTADPKSSGSKDAQPRKATLVSFSFSASFPFPLPLISFFYQKIQKIQSLSQLLGEGDKQSAENLMVEKLQRQTARIVKVWKGGRNIVQLM